MLRETTTGLQDGRGRRPGPESGYGEDLAALEAAILATVAYRDLFDYPVTAEEIHRYLHEVSCSPGDVADALGTGALRDKYLVTDGHYFALREREQLFDLRRRREERAKRLWPIALAHSARLARLPFVRMVAITGSLAVNNPGHDADTDFMLVTDRGRVWSVRLLAKVLQFINKLFAGGELCVNHVISTAALELEGRSLYVAQELAQMVPVYGADTYAELRASNPWSTGYLPNAAGMPDSGHALDESSSILRRTIEVILRGRLGNRLESWECRRKLHKYNDTEFLLGRATEFRAEATGHRRNVKENIEAAFADRMKGPRFVRGNLRVLLGQAYHLKFDPKLWRAMQPFPPLGTLYAASVARDLGHDVRVHDSMLSVSLGEWRAALQINNPDVVVLYEDNFNYLTKMCLLAMRDAAVDMIRMAKDRGATVMVCSSDSADEPLRYLKAGADYIIIGEGEETLADMLRIVNGESDMQPEHVPGIAYLDQSGELATTGRRPVIRHIDQLSLPAWDLIDLRRYRDIWSRRHGRLAVNLVTTRGCPYHCNWCAKPIWGQRYNARTPADVITEITWLREMIDFEYIWFMDDIFGLKPRWVSSFADQLEEAGIGIRFKCLSRPDLLLRAGETEALARAGCDIVWMGAESGSQSVLDAMEKGTTVENIVEACAALRRQDIRVGLFIQFGYPGETLHDVRSTIRMIREIMPDELGISVSYPLPGTRFYDRIKTALGDTRHWQDSDDLAMLFRGPYSTRFYRVLHRYVHSDVGMRRAWRNRRWALCAYWLGKRIMLGTAMAVLSRLPHKGIDALPAGMVPEAAATPSEQPVD